MKRVVILGRGASGKSTLARHLGDITGLLVIEVDKILWRPGLIATPREQWVAMQEKLIAGDRWIMDGDLGPNDAIEVRLPAADTIIFLDFSLVRCAWRAIRRSRERADFWRWLWHTGISAVRFSGQQLPTTRPMRRSIYFAALRHSVGSSRTPPPLRQLSGERVYEALTVDGELIDSQKHLNLVPGPFLACPAYS